MMVSSFNRYHLNVLGLYSPTVLIYVKGFIISRLFCFVKFIILISIYNIYIFLFLIFLNFILSWSRLVQWYSRILIYHQKVPGSLSKSQVLSGKAVSHCVNMFFLIYIFLYLTCFFCLFVCFLWSTFGLPLWMKCTIPTKMPHLIWSSPFTLNPDFHSFVTNILLTKISFGETFATTCFYLPPQ